MSFNVNRYLPTKKKKRSLFSKIKIKWKAHLRKTARKRREWEEKYGKNAKEPIEREYTWQEEKEYFSNIKGWIYFFKVCSPVLLYLAFVMYSSGHPQFVEKCIEVGSTILVGILYLIAWIVGILITLFIAKVTACFIYQFSVNRAAKFVADVLDEVDRIRKKDNSWD